MALVWSTTPTLPPQLHPCPPAAGPQSKGRKGLQGFSAHLGPSTLRPGWEGLARPEPNPRPREGNQPAAQWLMSSLSVWDCASVSGCWVNSVRSKSVLRLVATQMLGGDTTKPGFWSRAGYMGSWCQAGCRDVAPAASLPGQRGRMLCRVRIARQDQGAQGRQRSLWEGAGGEERQQHSSAGGAAGASQGAGRVHWVLVVGPGNGAGCWGWLWAPGRGAGT